MKDKEILLKCLEIAAMNCEGYNTVSSTGSIKAAALDYYKFIEDNDKDKFIDEDGNPIERVS